MADEKTRQMPKNIFELINQNIVDLSQDMVQLYSKVDSIYNALFPKMSDKDSEPNADGADTINE